MRRRCLDSCSPLYSITELICAGLYCFQLVVRRLLVVTVFIFQKQIGREEEVETLSASATQADTK